MRHFFLILAALVISLGCSKSGPSKSDEPATRSANVRSASSDANPKDPAHDESASTEAMGDVLTADKTAETSVTLAIGDPAPELSLGEWIKGEPVSGFEPGKLYVLEFWATWCGPCRVSMPHLSELQEKHAEEVTIIGISDEDREIVDEFLKKKKDDERTWDETITYRLALDPENRTYQAYMRAAGQNGIPTAFVIGRDGVIEWIGHPMELEHNLDLMLAGSWDREAARQAFKEEQERAQKLMAAMQKIRAATLRGNPEEAVQVIDDLHDTYPDDVNIAFQRIGLLMQAKQIDQARAAARELAEQHQESASLLNGLAWNFAESGMAELLEEALEFAKRATELSDGQDADILDTLARVYYRKGDLQTAIEHQQKAAELASGNSEIKDTLTKYQEELRAKSNGTEVQAADAEADASESPAEDDGSDGEHKAQADSEAASAPVGADDTP